jgi:hypothetical protein
VNQSRQTILWTLVAFFGAGLIFKLVGDATDGASVAVELAAQVAVLVVLLAAVTLVMRRRR